MSISSYSTDTILHHRFARQNHAKSLATCAQTILEIHTIQKELLAEWANLLEGGQGNQAIGGNDTLLISPGTTLVPQKGGELPSARWIRVV
jgi:hypothetical protein